MAGYQNNIFEVLNNFDSKNFKYFDSLSEEQYKELIPLILMRWMSNVQGKNIEVQEYYLLMVNELVNKYHWFMSMKYKKVLIYLLCCCGIGHNVKHGWIAKQKAEKTSYDKHKKVLKEFFNEFNEDEFKIVYDTISKEEKKYILENIGEYDKI